MMVCIVLIWFLLTVLQESRNIDAVFMDWFFRQPHPLFAQKQTFFNTSLNQYWCTCQNIIMSAEISWI